MLQFIAFAFIHGIMIFIWSFVYLNRSDDKINQAFLAFLTVILLWMILSVSNSYNDGRAAGLAVKTIYWYSMLNISLFFLLFIYRFIKRELDLVFYIMVIINTFTIFLRYLFPIDYKDPTFWRLNDPVVAPLMAAIFSVPAIFALFLVIRQYMTTKEAKQKAQLRVMFIGIGLALIISVISEYVLPTWFGLNTHLSLMYFAVFVFVVFMFISIMKHRLFNMQCDYIYRKLFLSSSDGIIIINKNDRIICINDAAKEILQNQDIDSGDKITEHIHEYVFETDYKQHEIIINAGVRESYLSVTQYPIDATDLDSEKLMIITDITLAKLKFQQEKDMLLEKSSLDQLNGLYNKHCLYDRYYTDRRETGEIKMVLMFIDVDGFKLINDLCGHLTGDRVLKSVAGCIKENIGDSARAFRFGGDEFIVIFENAVTDDTYAIAEQIRNKAKSLDFSQYDMDLKISLSIGLAQGTPPVKDLIIKADMAMYESKNSGKNQITIFSEKLGWGI